MEKNRDDLALQTERDAWEQTAMQFARNEEFWRGLVMETGRILGGRVYVQDDGGIVPEPLGLRVPEVARDVCDALRLILPLAKGYAHAHPVGSNQAYVDQAERLLASTAQTITTTPSSPDTQEREELARALQIAQERSIAMEEDHDHFEFLADAILALGYTRTLSPKASEGG